MKRIISILLVGSLLFASFKNISLYLYMEWKRDMIIENFCINLQKPEMLCSGKCYISKELGKAQDQQTNQQSGLKKIDLNTNYLLVDLFHLDYLNIPVLESQASLMFKNHKLGVDWIQKLLRPPNSLA